MSDLSASSNQTPADQGSANRATHQAQAAAHVSQLIQQLKRDYQTFPKAQTYSLYAEDVRFKDPLSQFEGLGRYRQMIGFLDRFFSNIQLDLHAIEQSASDSIATRWTMTMTAPVPWSPRLSISGRSELRLNRSGLIESHTDYWDCSRWDVLLQVFSLNS